MLFISYKLELTFSLEFFHEFYAFRVNNFYLVLLWFISEQLISKICGNNIKELSMKTLILNEIQEGGTGPFHGWVPVEG